MHQYYWAAIALPILYVLYLFTEPYISERRNARKAKKLNCEPAPQRPHKIGGIDMIYRVFQADKRHQVPNEFEKIYSEMNADRPTHTWVQHFFGKPTLFTVDPKNIQALLATQFNDFELGAVRRGNFFPMLGNGIFTADGKIWEHSRAMLRPQFARDQVGDLALEEEHVQDMFRHMPIDMSGWTSEVDLNPLFFRLTLDSATEFLFGQSVHTQISSLPNSYGEKTKSIPNVGINLAEVAAAFDRGTHTLGKRARFADQYWMHNPKQFRQDCKLVHQFADYYVNRALAAQKSSDYLEKGHGKQKYVFLDELAKATQDPIELRSQLLNILLAGRDTTAGLLGWTFWNLARHPETFEKLRSTVIESFGTYENTSEITFANLKACTYLQHTMSEVLRLFTNVPLNSRRAVRDTTIPYGGGLTGKAPVFVPKGTQVDYSVHLMHKRKDLWAEDADQFRPERWQGRRAGWEFLPFNGGPRICLGQQFALTEAGYVIVRMLQKYDAIENLDTIPENNPQHQYSVTTAPWTVPVRLHEARAS